MLHFDPSKAAPPPRAASTVIVLRPAEGGLEVFCVLRHQKSSFLGGAIVFPGGKVDEDDGGEAWAGLATAPHPRAAEMESPDASALALAVAACRESLEEAALIPLDPPVPSEMLLAMRRELEAGTPFAETLRERGVKLAIDALVPWGRWVTPEAEARRFDARFFLLALPEMQEGAHDEREVTHSFWATPAEVLRRFLAGEIFLALPEMQEGAHDEREVTHSFWATPAEVLRRFLAGEIFLAPPTCRTLELLAECQSMEDAVKLAGEQSLLPICPEFVPDDKAPFLALPGDPKHSIPEKRVAGKTRFVLRDARFLSEDP